MRFPLLIGIRPKYANLDNLAMVPLGRGRWRITANHTNSKLSVMDGKLHLLPPGGEVVIEGPAIVHIIITEAGDEAGIDAFAELISDGYHIS